jgi:hypothetical protein
VHCWFRHIGGIEVYFHSFLTSVLDSGEWSTSRPGRFTPGKEPRYLLNRRLGGSRSQSGHFGEKKKLLPTILFHATDICAFTATVPTVFRVPAQSILYTIRNSVLRRIFCKDLNYRHDIFQVRYPFITGPLYVIQIQQMNLIFPTYVRYNLHIK